MGEYLSDSLFIKDSLHLKSVTDIQDHLGLTCVQTVYRWLDGTNIPSIDNLYALSRLFGVKVDDMLAGDEKIVTLPQSYNKCMRLFMYYEKLKRTV